MIGPDGWIHLTLSQTQFLDFLKPFALLLNKLGKGDVLAFCCILLAIAGYLTRKLHCVKSAAAGIAALTSSGIMVQILKHLAGRARPHMNLGEFYFIGPNFIKDGFDSFPSGHAISSFTLAAFFSCCYPKWRWPLYLTAGSIGLIGRVYMHHHFLSDVIAGGVLGILIGKFFARWWKNWVNANQQSWVVGESWVKASYSQLITHNSRLFFDILLILAFSSIILFTGLTRSALWDRDETEYAQATIEMQEKNEWLIPTYRQKPFLEKPILLYWFTRASISIFGMNEFGFRFPSVLFGILTCIVTYFLGWQLQDRKTGLFSALILSSSFLFAGGFRLLLTDPLLVFFSSLTFLFYIKSQSFRFLAASYLSTGFSVLTKGPIGFFPVPVFLLFEWITQRQNPEFSTSKSFLKHALLSLIPIAIAAPWFIYSFSSQEQAASSFLLYENLTRFLQGMEGHTGPMFYYVIIIFLGLFPWSFFLIPYFKKEWSAQSDSKTLLFTLWFLCVFIFFSFSVFKLPHYMMIALPPLACLLGKFWREQIDCHSRPRSQLRVNSGGSSQTLTDSVENPEVLVLSKAFKAILGVSILFIAALISLYFIRPQYASVKLIFPFVIFSGCVITAYLQMQTSPLRSFVTLNCGVLLLFVTFALWGLPWIEQHRVTKDIALAIKNVPEPNAKIAGYQFSEPSLYIYSGKLFPDLGTVPLDTILSQPTPVYIVITESKLKQSAVQVPYTIVAQKKGFAENHGEITLLLIRSKEAGSKGTR